MGWPEMAEKYKNPATKVAGPIRGRPAVVGREIFPAWSSGRPPPPWLAHVQWW